MSLRLSIVAFTFLALSIPAFSADAPDMLGKWVGTVDSAIHAGSTPYRTAETGKKITFAKEPIVFTLDIKEQQGARFGGEMSTDKRSEALIGHLYPDNKSGMMLDEDGRYTFNLSDAGTMQVCYDHTTPGSKVIACWTATKAP
jgi:hypothetical protein